VTCHVRLLLAGFAFGFLLPATRADDARTQKAANHRAFRRVQAPDVPGVKDPAWVRTPVDAFVLARLEAAGLRPALPADPRTLLRRVYLDLIGLPPTPAEQKAFLEDASPDAYSRVVDALLARPEYGERWGRHWLDVARYAETNGYERDGPKPSAWRYRDYVIDAFNKDKPFDRFVIEQLAGDELPESDAETQIATTFLRLGTFDDEPANPHIDRYDQLDDVLGVTATAFLGLTLRCARCHDHKFEPFSQADYYRMLAVFEPLVRPQNGRLELDRPVGTDIELAAYRQRIAKQEAERAELTRKIEACEGPIRSRLLAGAAGVKSTTLPPDAVAAFGAEPGKRTKAQTDLVKKYAAQLNKDVRAAATAEERTQLASLERDRTAVEARRPPEPPRGYIWHEQGTTAPVTHIFKRGDPDKPLAEVPPGLPAVLVRADPAKPIPTAHSTGRRTWLARWVASPDNPLTARVMVNRVWQHHFGRGIVATPNDFGVMGEAPTHPELLDWLAARFVADGWRLKPLHRLLVLSNTYRESSSLGAREDASGNDRRLSLFGRRTQPRLEAEAVRDSILAVSSRLNARRGGPSVYPLLPRAVLDGQSMPGDGWGHSDPAEAARRSIYVYSKRAIAPPELELLDTPDTTSPCEQRTISTTAPQALTFLNGAFTQEQSAYFADRLSREAGAEAAERIRLAFALALCRPPRAEELALALDFLKRQERRIAAEAKGKTPGDAAARALADFCLVLLNANEFVYPG
jgi:Protein of unknown function (DUF1549)/Protein of unknown function (DUF1553)